MTDTPTAQCDPQLEEPDTVGPAIKTVRFDAGLAAAIPADAIPADATPADATPATPRAPLFPNIPGNTAEVEEKAKTMLDELGAGAEDAEGLRSLHNLTMAIGLPAARESFKAMVEANNLTGARRSAALREIAAISPITEVGCMQVDYFNMITATAGRAYLVLDVCPAKHDLGAELKKLRDVVDGEKWVEVVKHMSMMVYLGRTAYTQMAGEQRPLLRRIYGRADNDPCDDLMKLGIDSRNTTMFVDPRWPTRVGIFVRLQDT